MDDELDPVLPPDTDLDDTGTEPAIDETEDELIEGQVSEPELGAPPVEQTAQQTRTNARIRAALAEKKEAQAKAEALQAQVMELLKGSMAQRNAPPPVDPAVEQQRLDMMSESERIAYHVGKLLSPMQEQLAKLNVQSQVTEDRAKFAAMMSGRPDLKRFEGKVETMFGELLAKGQGQSRESILKHLIGEAILTKGAKALSTARATGQENISRQTTRPTSGRSNVSGTEGRSSDGFDGALERLKRFHDGGGYI